MLKRILSWTPTALLLFFMVGSAIYYMLHWQEMQAAFVALGYPSYTVGFNAAAKILGGLAIVLPLGRTLREWAYAGYLFILLLALQAVWMSSPGIPWPMFGFLAIWALAYWQHRVRK